MKTLSYYILMGSISISIFACSNPNQPSDSVKMANEQQDSLLPNDLNNEPLTDADFIMRAYNSGLAEVEVGNIAQKKGFDQGVKDMGQSAVSDYSQMNETLLALAAKKNITLPTEIERKRKKEIETLNEKSDNIFDRGYTKMIIDYRGKQIRNFQNAERKAKDMDIKAFASETLPMIRKQLDAAEELKIRIPYY